MKHADESIRRPIRSFFAGVLAGAFLLPVAASALTNVDVALSNQIIGGEASYTISFTIEADMTTNTDYWLIDFPSNTVIPTAVGTTDIRIIDVTAGTDAAPESRTITDLGGGRTRLRIDKANNPDYTNGDLVQIMVGQTDADMVTNATTIGTNYTIDVSTSDEATPVTSSPFTLTVAQMTPATVTLSNNTVGATTSEYEITFLTSELVQDGEYFQIQLTGGTTVGGASNANEWRINGVTSTAATFTSNRISLQSRDEVLPGIVTIAHSAGDPDHRITNSATPGSQHYVEVWSSTNANGTTHIEPAGTAVKQSHYYTLKSTAAPTVTSVLLSSSTVSAISQYRIRSALAANAPMAAGDTLTYTFPSGTTIPASIATGNASLKHGASTVTIGSIITNPTNRTVKLVLSATLAASGPDTLTLTTSASIANPPATGSGYQIAMHTTLQPNDGSSTTYSITSSSTLTPSNVIISPSTFRTASQYTISFAIGSSSQILANLENITIVFPAGTELPSSISSSNVQVNSYPCYTAVPTPATRTLVITPGANIDYGAAVTIVISSSAGVKTPTSTGTYTLSLSTSDETAVTSNSYTVTESTVGSITVDPSSLQPTIETAYTVDFAVGSGGNLVAGSSSITIDFHDSTTVASSIPASDISVNGTLVSLTPTIDTGTRTITLTSPVNVSANGSVSVVIASGITNPNLGDYVSYVNTSVETTPVASESYTITTATSVSNVTSATSNGAVSATATYMFAFTTTNLLRGGNDRHSIYADFPSGFTVSGAGATVTENGAGVALRPLQINPTSGIVQMILANAALIPASSDVVVTLTGIVNASTAKGNYLCKVYTTTDANPTNAPYVTLTSSTSLASVAVTPAPTTENTIAAYTVQMTTAANAVMTAGVDTFYVWFPSGTTVPATIAPTTVTVNGTAAAEVSVLNDTVKVVSPVGVSASTAVSIAFNTSAGIRNPADGTQTYKVKTNLQRTLVNDTFDVTPITYISPANIVPSPTTVNTAAQYSLEFTMGGTALVSGNTVAITFPDNTSIPSSMSTSVVTLAENDVTQSLSGVSTNPSTRVVTITVGEAVAAGAAMQLTITAAAGIVNPTTVSSGWTVSMTVTSNGTATSNVYATANSQTTPATVTPSPSTESATAAYTIAFTTGAGGALSAGTSSITLTFPSGTTVPSFIAANQATVNGVLLAQSPTINASARTVTLTSPVNVANGAAVSVVFSLDAGITNPSIVSTGYTLRLYTNKETTEITSYAFAITRGSDITLVSATLDTKTKNTVSTYRLSFTNGTTAIAAGDTLYAVFPAGTTMPTTLTTANVLLRTTAASWISVVSGSRLIAVRVNTTVASGDTATLKFTGTGTAGITNPATTGSNFTLTLRVDWSATPITSAKYAVTTATALSSVTVTPSPATVSTAASYSISATTSSDGALVVGDTVVVTFPAGTTVPASMPAAAVSVNGVTATVAPVSNAGTRVVKVITPTAVGASSSLSVVFGAGAGLVNPASTGSAYTVSEYTDIQPTAATSASYTISGSSVLSAATVTPTPATANTIAQYGLSFALSSVSGLVSGNTITITFPAGTTVPSSIDAANVVLTDDGVTLTQPSAVTTTPATRVVTITVADAVAAGSVMTVTIAPAASIRNPATAGNSYTLTIAATNNGSTGSNVYTITASQTNPATVTPSPATASVAAAYTISFTTGAGGALSAGSGTIMLTFPAGTTIPTTIAANTVTVNGTALAVAPSCTPASRTIEVTSPVGVANAGSVSLVIAVSAGITNPAAGTNHSISVHTSTEPTDVQSAAYTTVAATSIANVQVTLGSSVVSTATTYTITFTTGTGGIAVNDDIYLTFPAGTTVPATFTTTTVTLNTIAAQQVTATPATRQVIVRANTTVSAGQTATVRFLDVTAEKLTNPASTGSNYTVTAKVGAAATPVSSARYTIIAPLAEYLGLATVSVTPATANTGAAYTITTSTGANGALTAGDTVFVTFPTGTTVPASMSPSAATVNGVSCVAAPVTDPTNRTVKVITATEVGSSASLVVNLTGLTNPGAGSSYTLSSLRTNIETVSRATPSNTYTIFAASQVSAANVTVLPDAVSANAQYTLAFVIGGTGDLVLNTDVISVEFPSGTTVPATIAKSNITVNGVNAGNVSVTGQRIDVTVGSTIATGSSVTMIFKSGAGIANPSSVGTYTLDVWTSKEATHVTSNVYAVSVSTISGTGVTLTNQLVSQRSQYTFTFTTGAGGALASGSGTITATFPTGTGIGAQVARTGDAKSGDLEIFVNGTVASTVTVNGLAVMVTVPAALTPAISANSSVTLVFENGSGMITNPSTASNTYSASVKTSAETTPVSTPTYAITTTTTVTQATVTLSPGANNGDGESANYTAAFSLGASGALTAAAGDVITLTFPSGTGIASLGTADVTVNTANPATAPTVSGLDVTIPLPSGASYANSASMTVVIGIATSKITNPATTGSNKTLSVSTTREPNPISSDAYTIVSASTQVTAANVSVNPSTISEDATYTITFTAGAKGGLLPGDLITVTFPAGTTVPASMLASDIRVNSTAPEFAPTCYPDATAPWVRIASPVSVAASAQVEIVLFKTESGATSNIVNPSTAGFRTLTVATTIEPTAITSAQYGINTNVQTGTLTVATGSATISNATVTNGQTGIPVLQVNVTASAAEAIDITAFQVKANGTGDDAAAISSVKLYADANGNGVVDGDALLGTATYSADNGIATISVTTSVPASNSRVWLVTWDVSAEGISGRTHQPSIVDNTYLTATGATSGNPIAGDDLTITAAPINGATLTLATATVTASAAQDIASGSAAPGSESFGLLKVTLTASGSNALLESITVDNTHGSGVFDEADVDSAKVFRDTGNGTFSASEDVLIGRATVTGASGGSGTVTFSTAATVRTTGTTFFIAYDVNASANILRNIAVRILNTGYLTVTSPATVASTNFPLQSTSEATLPVELISFDATSGAAGVTVTWETASESRNARWRLFRLEVADAADTLVLAAEARSGRRPARLAAAQPVGVVAGQGTTRHSTSYRYTDVGVASRTVYAYYLADEDWDGQQSVHGPVFVAVAAPARYELGAAWPNPFNPATTVQYALPAESRVNLAIYNVLGQPVATLVASDVQAAGTYRTTWDGRDASGRQAASGVYVCRLVATSTDGGRTFSDTRRMTMAR